MRAWLLLAVVALSGCPAQKPVESHRYELRRVDGTSFKIIPAAGQLPFCLAFTTSSRGVVRQLTMTEENASLACEAGKPLQALHFRVPADEGTARVHVLFSDQKLSAASVGRQMFELVSRGQDVRLWDLQLPGHVTSESQSFEPQRADDGGR